MVKPSTFGVNRDETAAEQRFLEETFGDLLPVAIRSDTYGANCLTQRMMRLLSMEAFFLAMYDCPDKLHALMALLRDNASRRASWAPVSSFSCFPAAAPYGVRPCSSGYNP